MDPKAAVDVAILGAVPLEVKALTQLLKAFRMYPFRCQTLWLGEYANLSVVVATTGLGKVNAAITTASLLEHFSIARVWNVGCAGSYLGGPLGIGDVLVTDRFLCGDEGIMTQQGVLPVSAIGIPLLVRNGEELYDHLPPHWNGDVEAIINQTPPGSYRHQEGLPLSRAEPSATSSQGAENVFTLAYGPSLTVSMASGDPGVASERFRHFGAYAENMEGSAVAQACFRFDTPAVECRGISNLAGVRAKETWQMEKSIAHCHGIVINWLEALNALKLLK